MTTWADTGRQLEQQMAVFFGAHGYATTCNAVLEGRSGGRHEIDVLAEKSDALTTFRVAVECKAWQQPIEKDVVAKLHYVVADLGLDKGIVVSLAGARIGATRTAADLGIELWGPDELRRHLGDGGLAQLTVPAAARTTTLAAGYLFRAPPDQAERLVRSSGKGRLGIRTVEPLVWFSHVWLPAWVVRITVAQPEVKRLRTRLRSATFDNLYEALGGGFLGRVPGPAEHVQVDARTALPPLTRDVKVHGTLRKAVQDYERVSSPSAVQRHTASLARLGVPTPCTSLTIGGTSLAYLPYFVGVLDDGGRHRAVAVDGRSGAVSETVSKVLTVHLAQLAELRSNAPR